MYTEVTIALEMVSEPVFRARFVPCSVMMEIEFICVGKPLQIVGYKFVINDCLEDFRKTDARMSSDPREG